MYQDAPGKEAFTAQIKKSLVRSISLADLISGGKISKKLEDHEGDDGPDIQL